MKRLTLEMRELEVISNPVWLGWSINIEFMIGATLVFIM
jgi:hypothetical protein